MKAIITAVCLGLLLSSCYRHMPPGHDPRGPGNSENAPGHNKYKNGNSPGNSGNAPVQNKGY
jgi:hypothetical protein